MKFTKQTILATLIGLGSMFMLSGAASASTQNITITPTTIKQDITPNTAVTGSFSVFNQGTSGYNFKVYANPYYIKGQEYTPVFQPIAGRPDISKWFSFSTPSSYVAPGQSQTITYTINVPSGILVGDYYAAIFAETQAPPASTGITINERVGSLVYLEVPGNITRNVSLDSFSSNWLQQSPLKANLKLTNTGGGYTTSNISISVRDILGNAKYNVKSTKIILPQTTRLIDFSWPSAPSLGLFQVNGTATSPTGDIKLPTQYVIVMSTPIRIMLITFIVLLIIGVEIRHRLRQKKVRKKRKK
jgi:hypothetical protein